MKFDPWKATTFVLAGALALAVGLQATRSADAQAKPGPSPGKDDPPAVRAGKVLDKARETVSKAKKDKAGHRDKALKQIDVAISESKSLSGGPEGGEEP
jgi:hypothetical protein